MKIKDITPYLCNKFRYLFKKKSVKNIKNGIHKFNNVVYSPDFFMGIKYTNAIGEAKTGFIGKYILLDNNIISLPKNEMPLPNYIFAILESDVCMDMSMESLNPIKQNYKMLGNPKINMERDKNPVKINLKDCISYEYMQ